jgi:2',3'-cyclic-nucleotide 2'-phosphodiesterase (5'-nucleotidase family)
MKRCKKFLIVLLVFAIVFSMIPAASAAPETKSIRILFTHDMHASLLPAEVADSGGNLVESGGFARLSAAIEEERSANPGDTLLVDAGDYSMGTLFQTLYTIEAPELALMGAIGYDAVTAGNHEFDYSIGGFTKSLEAAKQGGGPLPQYVISNMTLPQNDPDADALRAAMADYGVKDYTVIVKGGIKIGIFGLLGADAAANAPNSTPGAFTDIVATSKRVVDILKNQEKVDLIVCLSHSGTWANSADSEDELLAKAVPDIDVIISGHTHTVLRQPIIVGHTVIASCGAYNANLGVLDLSYDNGWNVKDYRLKPIDSSVKGDPAIAARIDAYKGMIDQYMQPFGYTYDQVIANSPYQFSDSQVMFDHPADYALGNLLSDAYVYAVKQAEGKGYVPVDVAVVPVGMIRATINKGDVTVSDAFNVLPLGLGPDGYVGYPLISVYLTGAELKNVCEVDASVAPIIGDAQLYLSGVRYAYDNNWLIFNKVQDAQLVKPDGGTGKINPDKLYRVVCGLYTGQMLAYVKSKSFGIISIDPKDKDGNLLDMDDLAKQIIYADNAGQKQETKEWQAVVEYLGSFPKQNGVSVIPGVYAAAQGRKVIDNSPGIFSLIANMNVFAWIVAAIIIVLLALLIFIIVRIATRKKRRARI